MCSHLSRRKDIVEVFKEGLILDFIVSKNEGDAFALGPSCVVQHFEVIREIIYVVCSKINKQIKTPHKIKRPRILFLV